VTIFSYNIWTVHLKVHRGKGVWPAVLN